MKSPTQRMLEILNDSVIQSSITPVLESRLKVLLYDAFQDCIGECAEFVRNALHKPPTKNGVRDQIAHGLLAKVLE